LKGQELCMQFHGLREPSFEKGHMHSQDQTGKKQKTQMICITLVPQAILSTHRVEIEH
jgi:hypothetical protein